MNEFIYALLGKRLRNDSRVKELVTFGAGNAFQNALLSDRLNEGKPRKKR